MAWQTRVYLHRGVPIDSGNYPWFDSNAAVRGWMDGFAMPYTGTANSYQREARGSFKVNVNHATIELCQYISWENLNFSNLRYYGRITSMLYVSPECTEVFYETDALLTYMGLFSFQECFVVREHVQNDWQSYNSGNFAWRKDEGIDPGETITINTVHRDGGDQRIVLQATQGSDDGVTGSFVNGVYNGGFYVTSPDPSVINAYLSAYVAAGKEAAIVSVTQVPFFVGDALEQPAGNLTAEQSIDGYTPENAKALLYPLQYVEVSNNEGESGIYRFENFNDGKTAEFRHQGSGYINPTWICWPQNYNGEARNYDEGICVTNFPVCAASGDAFKTWAAQSGLSNVIKGLSSAATVGVGIAAAPATGGLSLAGSLGGAASIVNQGAQVIEKALQPKTQISQATGSTLSIAQGRQGFTIKHKTARADSVIRADSRYKAFGYLVEQTKVPNTSRPVHFYLKLENVTLTNPNMPYWAVEWIAAKLRGGLHFWRDGENWGNYSLDNRG